jgi:hypothetical protein
MQAATSDDEQLFTCAYTQTASFLQSHRSFASVADRESCFGTGRRAVLAMAVTAHGAVGEPAPVHPHLFRHARVRQMQTDSSSSATSKPSD